LSPRPKANLKDQAIGLPVATKAHWKGGKPVLGPDIRTTTDADVANKLKAGGYAEFLQSPKRGKQPTGGKPPYVVRIFPNGDGPISAPTPSGKKPTTTRAKSGPTIEQAQAMVAFILGEEKKLRGTMERDLKQKHAELKKAFAAENDPAEEANLLSKIEANVRERNNLAQTIRHSAFRAASQSDEGWSKFATILSQEVDNK
jgi:hypothetical protein